VEIANLGNAIGCSFERVRNTNTNWSNNTLTLPIVSRAWGLIGITNAKYLTADPLTYYVPNLMNNFYDSTLTINNPTNALTITGLAGENYTYTGKFYDCNFIGKFYNSAEDLTYRVFEWASIKESGFEFFYSLNGFVRDDEGNLLDGVNIDIYNNTDTLETTITTTSGVIPKTYLSVLRVKPIKDGLPAANVVAKTRKAPYKIVFSKDGYETYQMCFSPTEKVTENVALKKAIDMLIDTRT
jgi:hypothetical protein